MLGAVIGDIVGSRFERTPHKSKDFSLFTSACRPTDDSVMTLAIAQALLECPDLSELSSTTVRCMRDLGRTYPHCGYGGRFLRWLMAKEAQPPYGSFGNGSAMRVSACAFAAGSRTEALNMARLVTQVSHDHPEGLKGAAAVTDVIWMAREGKSTETIRDHVCRHYYPLDFTLDEIRPNYRFDVTCMGSVPQAIVAFLESTGFEDALRNAISLGGDSDTLAAMAGGMAQARYGIPPSLREQALSFLDAPLISIVNAFEKRFPAP